VEHEIHRIGVGLETLLDVALAVRQDDGLQWVRDHLEFIFDTEL
jgi:hypothetical protein